jgi:hypothetical protein
LTFILYLMNIMLGIWRTLDTEIDGRAVVIREFEPVASAVNPFRLDNKATCK